MRSHHDLPYLQLQLNVIHETSIGDQHDRFPALILHYNLISRCVEMQSFVFHDPVFGNCRNSVLLYNILYSHALYSMYSRCIRELKGRLYATGNIGFGNGIIYVKLFFGNVTAFSIKLDDYWQTVWFGHQNPDPVAHLKWADLPM